MSYNITNWKIRELHLELPLTFDFQEWVKSQPDQRGGYENVGKRWCLEDKSAVQINLATQMWRLNIQGSEIAGEIAEGKLMTLGIDAWMYDGSGTLYSDILLPLFQQFRGTLKALVIWEHGDIVTNLSIADGVVSEEKL
jgi:hypothetical protein